MAAMRLKCSREPEQRERQRQVNEAYSQGQRIRRYRERLAKEKEKEAVRRKESGLLETEMLTMTTYPKPKAELPNYRKYSWCAKCRLNRPKDDVKCFKCHGMLRHKRRNKHQGPSSMKANKKK